MAENSPDTVLIRMWTDMSEIVRPTRDGIHGREYISTSVDIGRKPSFLALNDEQQHDELPRLMMLPMPLIIDMIPERYSLPALEAVIAATAVRTDLVAIIDSRSWPVAGLDNEKHLSRICFLFLVIGAAASARYPRQDKAR